MKYNYNTIQYRLFEFMPKVRAASSHVFREASVRLRELIVHLGGFDAPGASRKRDLTALLGFDFLSRC